MKKLKAGGEEREREMQTDRKKYRQKDKKEKHIPRVVGNRIYWPTNSTASRGMECRVVYYL